MNKSEKMKAAARNNRKKTVWAWLKKIILFPWRVIKAIWRGFVRVCRAIWNWLKSINIVGMINLTLLVAIIVLFCGLISNVVCCRKMNASVAKNGNVTVTADSYGNAKAIDNRRVVKRKIDAGLPMKKDAVTGITPKIKVVGVKKPVIDKNVSVPARELPKQNLYGDVIVDNYPSSVILMNGVNVNGNLYVQNMRKYTLPCGAKIMGNLFIRNVEKLSFCGAFSVRGNIYVTHRSSFGPIPHGTYVGGQVIL